jgi:hypothetical protein
MRRSLLLRAGTLFLSGLLIAASRASAQDAPPACTLTADSLRSIVTRDGRFGMVFPSEMSRRGDTLLILGVAEVGDSSGRPIARRGNDSLLVGFLLTDGRRAAIPIAAPRTLPLARYFRSRPTVRGWESVFFVPDRDTIPGLRAVDTGTLWYGELVGSRWRNLERIGRIQGVTVMTPNSSTLVRRGRELYFALFTGEPFTPGSVLTWSRREKGRWRVDTLPLKWGPLSVTTSFTASSDDDVRFYPVVGVWEGGMLYPGSLLAVDASRPTSWSMVRRSATQSMNRPVEIALGDTLHVSWWEFDAPGKPSVWYQPLDPRRENAADLRRRVARGVNHFMFFAIPEDARMRLVWAYPSPSTMDSAAVAVVANGEPVAVGQVAFPFGFMTNGVTSGDRSFILATTPRPTPGAEPSASRTLEVRVNCTGGT